MAADDARADWTDVEEDDYFLMSNLYPRTTGLPLTVWVSAKGAARHDVRVKVNIGTGDWSDARNVAVVAVRPEPHLLHGDLAAKDLRPILEWVRLNRDVIIDHWEGRADSMDLIQRHRRLPS